MFYKIIMILIVICIPFANNLFAFSVNGSKSEIVYKKEEITSLNSLIDEALKNNPEMKSFRENWESSKLRISQAGVWNDPQLSFNIVNLPSKNFDFGLEPMTGKQLLFVQRIPFPGKSSLKEKISEEEAGTFENLFLEKKNEIIKRVKTVYFELYLVDKSIEITMKNKELLSDFVRIAQKKYEVGKGLQQDVLKAQVEFSKILEKLITLNQKRVDIVARLNSLLNRPTHNPIFKLEEIEKVDIALNLEELEKTSFRFRPMLKAMERVIEKNEYAYQLAKKDYYPDFNAALGYTQRDNRRDFISIMFSINIPLYAGKKQSKKVEEVSHNISVVRESYINMKNDIKYKIIKLSSDLEKGNELLDLLVQGIIPQASQSLQSAIAGYQVDKVDFLTLIDNQLTLFNYEIEHYRVLTDYGKDLAELEFIIGKQLT